MVEVLMAALLLGAVAAATGALVSSLGSRSGRNLRLSDPALETVIALRRLGTLAPAMRCVLVADSTRAALWLSDDNPNLAVDAREVGLVRFDAENGELLLETIAAEALDADPSLDAGYEDGAYDAIVADFDELRAAGALEQRVLAEGIESVVFRPSPDTPNTAQMLVRSNGYEMPAVLAPIPLEVPLR